MTGGGDPPPPRRLPSGRHGLSREEVVMSQRGRLLGGMLRAVSEKGYRATSVADVIRIAGVSRATFYAQFDDKEDCFLAAHSFLVERLKARITEAYGAPGPWPDRVRRALQALLRALEEYPQLTRVAFVEVIAAGPRAHDHFRTSIRSFLPLFDEGREHVARGADLPPTTSRVALGALTSILFEEVAAEHAGEASRLLPDVLYSVLVQFIGHDDALKEVERTLARGRG